MFSFKKFFNKILKQDINNELESTEKSEEVVNENIVKIERYYNDELEIDDDSLTKAEKDFRKKMPDYSGKYPQCEFFASMRDYKCRIEIGGIIKFLTTDIRNVCGRIVDFDDDYIYIEIDKESESGRLLLYALEKDRYNLHACGRYTSAISYPDGPKAINRIITFDIVHDVLE